ncbi:type VI secretion system baseplate subunit TssE [Parendozoicomonas sp. Alg238-R29]|uniref:type VI secretion system baseplate subunit TssE n=1 Tax=Parendozoicomonas sp. Alg238-R29 TaxID=2993446 RepID=UPI00248EDF33|nr:type VI secretion system baseplate subunit TssE [Parendozoicomonas sp. Alg238-R29]
MSLLDHFLDHQSGAQQNTNVPYSTDLRESVCRNLEMVLESRRSVAEVNASSIELKCSLYNYGMGNLHRCRNSVEISEICRDLEGLIQTFEPRLQQIVVELEQIDEQHNALCFHIEASVAGQNGEREVFDTTINLTNSTLMIEGYQP